MRLETERLVIRELEDRDAEEIAREINSLEVSKHLLLVPYPYRFQDAEQFIEGAKEKAAADPREVYELAIELKTKNKYIGGIGLSKIDYYQGTGTIGYWLAKPYWRQGYMSEAFSAVIEFAFTQLGLCRIDIGAFIENEASNNLIKKMGFVYEGTHRKKVRAKSTGNIHDEHVYGLLKEDWEVRRRLGKI